MLRQHGESLGGLLGIPTTVTSAIIESDTINIAVVVPIMIPTLLLLKLLPSCCSYYPRTF